MEESYRSKQKVPQDVQSAGFKKKQNKKTTNILPLTHPFSTGELAPSLSPQPPPPKGRDQERAEGLFRISHPFYSAPSVLNFQDKNHKMRRFGGESNSEIFLLGTRKERETECDTER